MRLPSRLIGTGLAGLVLLLGGAASGSAVATSPSQSPSDDTSEAIGALGACLASGQQGDVLLVFDTSGSLKKTDPEGQRVEAAAYLIRQLQAYVEESGAKVDLAIGGFADKLSVSTDWTTLSTSSETDLVSEVARYRDLDNGFETDYWSAASGAREQLAERSEGKGKRCQAWLWFSDGQHSLTERKTASERDTYDFTKPYGPDVELTSQGNVAKLEMAGRKDLCRQGGVADQLRVQGIITLAVGLSAVTAKPDFALMKGVATGSDVDGQGCGEPSAQAPGAFILADDVSDLLFAFDQLSDPDHPPIIQESGLCQGEECEEGTHQFVLDTSITKAHVIAGADVPDFYVVLTAPDGTSETIQPGADALTTRHPGYTLDGSWLDDDDNALEIDIGRVRDKGWVGQWRLTFVDAASGGPAGQARSSIHLYGDVVPAWRNATAELRSGENVDLELGLARAGSGETIADPTSLTSDVLLDAVLQYADGTEKPIASGLTKQDLANPVKLDLNGSPPGEADIHLTVRLTTADTQTASGPVPGTALEPQSVDVPVTILPAPNFPSVPGSISFGETDSAGERNADLKVEGDGCVWLDGDSKVLTLPEGVEEAAVTSSANTEDECASGSLPLTLSVSDVGSGLVSGDLTVMTAPAEAAVSPVPVTVRYELEMQRPRNDAVFWPLLVGITLAGLLIPIGLLYLVKWRTAEVPGNSLMVGSVHGTLDAGGGASFLAPHALTEQGMRSVTLPGTRRRFPLNSSSEVRTKTGLGLTEPGYVVVTGQPSVSSAKPATTRGGKVARLPLAVQDNWVALLDPANPGTGPIEVVFLVAPTSGKLAELLVDARNRAPDLVAQLRSRLGSAGAPAVDREPDEWGGSPGPDQAGSSKPSEGSSSNWDEW